MMSEWLDASVVARLYAGVIDVVVIKGTGIVFVAALGCYALRRSSAAIRAAVWAASFLVLLTLPALQLATPRSDVTVVGARTPAASVARLPVSLEDQRPSLEAGARDGSGRAFRPAPTEGRRPVATVAIGHWHRWMVAIWCLGLLLQLGRLAAHLHAVRRLRAGAEIGPAGLQSRVQTLAADLGLHPPIAIISSELEVPSAFGLMRPTVALPRSAARWSKDQLDAALLHEISHLKRRDYATHLVAEFVNAVYWINPAIWYAGRRLDMERERACDDGVVSDRIDPIRYAEYLMSLAWRARERAVQPALSFANRSSLPERVRSLLDRAQTRAPLGTAGRVAIVAIAAAVVVPAAAVEIFGIVQSPAQHATALADPDPLVRRHAAWALGEAESTPNADVLIEHLADSDPRVRAVSAWALGEIKHPRAIAPLTALLEDDDPWVREMAVLAIGEIEDPSGLPALRSADPASVSGEARAWAIAEIELMGDGSDVFAGKLVHPDVEAANLPRYLEDLGARDPRTRALAAERLGLLGAPEAVDPLLDALGDENPSVRAAAVWALDEINPSSVREAPEG